MLDLLRSIIESHSFAGMALIVSLTVLGVFFFIGMAFGVNVFGQVFTPMGQNFSQGIANLLGGIGTAIANWGESMIWSAKADLKRAENERNSVTIRIASPTGAVLEVQVEGEEPSKLAAPGAAKLLEGTGQTMAQLSQPSGGPGNVPVLPGPQHHPQQPNQTSQGGGP